MTVRDYLRAHTTYRFEIFDWDRRGVAYCDQLYGEEDDFAPRGRLKAALKLAADIDEVIVLRTEQGLVAGYVYPDGSTFWPERYDVYQLPADGSYLRLPRSPWQ